jgi:regulator of sigma E protease
MITALLVIGILIFLIVVHEFGHFIAAKIFRIRVEEFGIGYPPRAFTFARWGGTEYTLNWIPFGGFVRLFGDQGEAERGRGSYIDTARWKQALVLVAGVVMNAIAAYFLFAAALNVGIPRVVDTVEPGVHSRLLVAQVVPGSPADAAGIRGGDEIVAVVDERGASLQTLTPDSISDFIRSRGGVSISITYLHENATSTAVMIPTHAVIPDAEGRPALGLAPILVSSESLPWGKAFVEAFSITRNAFVSVAKGLGNLFNQALQGKPSISQVVGPIGLVQVVGDAARSGVGNVLALAAFISVNLAIINLLPIPALDGGRLVLLGVEGAMRRPAPRIIVRLLNAIGLGLVILIMITVTYNDIGRLLA